MDGSAQLAAPLSTSARPALSSRTAAGTGSAIRDLLSLLDRPDILSFAGGTPHPDLLPLDLLAEAYAGVLADPALARVALQYSGSQGYLPLRRKLAELMSRDGAPCDERNIAITAGSQQALDLLGKLFISAGSAVAIDAPTYLGALEAFKLYEPRFCDLGARLAAPSDGAQPTPSLIYLTADFANPSGRTLTRVERGEVVAAAHRWNSLIVEDAAYRPLRYEGADVPSILALDAEASGGLEHGRTAFCGTLSKTLSPALRLGWICAPSWLIEQIALLQQGADLHASTINQVVAARALGPHYDAHLEGLRKAYSERARAMQGALARHMPPTVTWTRSEGGFFTWLTLPRGADGQDLLKRSLTEAGVAFVPGAAFYGRRPNHNTLRLSHSMLAPEEIDLGVGRLASLLRPVLGGL